MAQGAIKAIYTALIALSLFLAGLFAYLYVRLPIDRAVVYAADHEFNALLSTLGYLKARNTTSCPSQSFAVASPLRFLVAQMDSPEVDQQRLRMIFEHFQSVGCNINAIDDGRTPLHDAILFCAVWNCNRETAGFLIDRGASLEVRVQKPARHAGLNAVEYAEALCQANSQNCAGIREILQTLQSIDETRPLQSRGR